MSQYELNNNVLHLRVKKAPLFLRLFFFLVAFILFFGPTTGMILAIAQGNGLHAGFFITIGACGLAGFYSLRMALWNTYGSEKIVFERQNVTYEADYKWFKDGKKTKEIDPLSFSVNQVGYEEDNQGLLIIGTEEQGFQCVTKMQLWELDELVKKLQKLKKS